MKNGQLKEIGLEELPSWEGMEPENVSEIWRQFDDALPKEVRRQNPEESFRVIKAWTGICRTEQEKYLYSLIDGSFTKPVLLICCDLWVVGGIERVMVKLIEHFSREYQIVLLSLETKEQGYPVSEEAASVKLTPQFPMPDALRAAILAKLLNTDIFLGNANQSAEFLPVYECLKLLKIKSVMMNHCHYLYPYHWECFLSKAMKIRKDAVQSADVVLFLTGISAALCTLNGRRAGVMPNPNTFEVPADTKNPALRGKNIVAVGRFQDPVKRVDKILETFAGVYRKDPEAKLTLVGKYDPSVCCDESRGKSVGCLLEELKLPPEAVVFAGETIHVEEYYRDARVLLFASECEGFGLVLNEAAAFGIPAVAYYYSGIEDIITDGQNGFIVEKEQTGRAAEKTALLLEDDELFCKMSQNAVSMAERFTEEKVFGKWEEVFRILRSAPGTRRELEEKLTDAEILKDLKFPEETLFHCIREYGACTAGMTERICRCDDLLELLHAQYVSVQAENEELRAKLGQQNEGTGSRIAGFFRRRL